MFTLTFDLQKQNDPYLRLGILGLLSACTHVRDPHRRHLYSRVPGEDLLKWEIDEEASRITLHYASSEALEQFSDAIWGDFEKGFAVPPGFTDDLSDDRIYTTAFAHDGLTSMFIDGHHMSSRRVTRIGKNALEFFTKDHPEIKLETKLGSAYKNKKLAEGEDPELLTVWIAPHTPHTVTTVVKGEKKELVRHPGSFKTKEGEALTGAINSPGNLFHPACGIWNNCTITLARSELFLLSFANLAYAFAKGTHTVALGLDLPTFKDFLQVHKAYRELFAGNTGCVYMTQCEPKVVAGVLARLIGLPENRTYPFSYAVTKNGQVKAIPHGTLLFTKKAGSVAALLWEQGREPAGVNRVQTEKLIWRMKRAVLVAYNDDKVLTVYDQVWDNLISGRPWYAGFQVLANRKPEDGRVDDLLYKLSSQLEGEMERKIGDAIRTMRYFIVKQRQEKGWADRNAAYDYARDFMVKARLRRVTNRVTLDTVLSQIMIEAGYGFSREETEYIASQDPRHMAALLIKALYERKPKQVEEGVPVDPKEADEPEGEETVLDSLPVNPLA